MDVVSVCPFRTGSILWQPRRGTWALTLVCKATYDLVPGEARLAHEQEYPNDDDNHWNDDPARSLYSPTDLVPFKPRADLLLVGHAFAPRGEPVRSVIARIIVGSINKAIEAFGERAWTQDSVMREGGWIVKIPIRYERAAGGPDTWNPVGVRPDVADIYGAVTIPNLQPAGVLISNPSDRIEPIGFGPIAPSWPSRKDKLGPKGAGWSDANWHQQPMPEGLEPSYFNAAPWDQQLDELRPNEHLTLENLHPEHPRLVTNLPGLWPRAFVERPGMAVQELMMRADTLWIDTDRALCTLTWRGQLPLDRPMQPGRVVVAMEEPAKRTSWPEVQRLAGPLRLAGQAGEESTGTMDIDVEELSGAPATARAMSRPEPPAPPRAGSAPSSPTAVPGVTPFRATMPFVAAAPPAPGSRPSEGRDALSRMQAPAPRSSPATAAGIASLSSSTTSGLPFVAPASGSPDPQLSKPTPAVSGRGHDAGPAHPEPAPAAPGDASPPWLTQSRRPSGVMAMQAMPPPASSPSFGQPLGGQSPPPPSNPSFGQPLGGQSPPPPPVATPAAPVSDSPWASGAAVPKEPNTAAPAPAGNLPPPPPPVSAPAFNPGASGFSPAPAPAGGFSPAPASAPISSSGASSPAPPPVVANAAGAGVAAASNAAAAANPWSAATTPPSSAPAAPPVQLRAALRSSARDVVDLLWFDPESVGKMREHERWKAMLRELEPPPADLDFDDEPPAEVPKAVKDRRDVFAIMTRAESTDAEGIQEAIGDAVGEDGTFAPPLILVAGEMHFPFDELETLKATVTAVTPLIAGDKKLKETVDTVNELFKTTWLQSSSGVAEGLTARVKEAFAQGNRMLPASYLDTHTDRMLLEQRHYQKRTVFGELWIRSTLLPAGSQTPVPAYLPESLTKQLPMFQRMKARLIAEAHMQQDEYENHPAALKVVALGRVVVLSARRRESRA